MDYEKLYKESLEKAKAFAAKYVGDGLLISSEGSVAKEFNEIFPELKESEDMIFKELIHNLIVSNDYTPSSKEIFSIYSKTKEDCIAWLEKQGEKKPVDYNEELKKCRENPLYFFDKYVKVKLKEQKPAWSEEDEQNLNFWLDNNKSIDSDKRNWLKSIKERVQPLPKQEWSEEDELMLNSFLHKLEVCDLVSNKEITWIKNKLKSIKHWKPSEEQMKELEYVTRGNSYPHLTSLYQDLKNFES